MNNISYRPMVADDLNAVLDIENNVHLTPWAAASFQPCINGRYFSFVACEGDIICGYVVYTKVAGESEILNIGVSKKMHGKGVGTALLEHVIEDVKVNCDNIFLEVRESNEAAIALYDKLYFCEVGRRANYYPAKRGSEDALIYALPL